MKLMKMILVLPIVALALAACGEKVEVEPAHVGRILTPNGWAPDIIPPSKFRLDACWAYCDKLVTIEAADAGIKEEFTLLMPKDQLVMPFDIRATISLRDDVDALNTVFDRIPAVAVDDQYAKISLDKIYKTYGEPIVRQVVRRVLAQYSINEVSSNREAINAELLIEVSMALEKTPLALKNFALADVEWPDVITQAKVIAKEREIAIEREEAEKRVKMIQLQTQLEVAKAERNIRRERAEAAREENQIFAESVSKEYVKYRELEILLAMAQNGNAVFLPMEALGTIGLQNRVFNPTQ